MLKEYSTLKPSAGYERLVACTSVDDGSCSQLQFTAAEMDSHGLQSCGEIKYIKHPWKIVPVA